MDYDQTDIAKNYDRGRDHGLAFLDLWMDLVLSQVKDQPIKTILDLGCGTGRFSEALAVRFDADVIAIDPSRKMLAQARRKGTAGRIRHILGYGESLPLASASVDLVFMSMVFHHFTDPAGMARECRRVLRDGATGLLRAGTRERISSYPYVVFFPASRPILEECLPTSSYVREVFAAAGFQITAQVVTQEIAPNHAAYADKLAAGADSVLARLQEEDFAAGMTALRSYAERVRNQAVYEPIDVFVFRLEPGPS